MKRPLLALVLAPLLAAGCGGDERSVEAFCESVTTFHRDFEAKYKPRAEELYAQQEEQPLLGFIAAGANLVEGLGDAERALGKIAAHAPDEIKVEAEAVHDNMKKQLDDAGDTNPMGGVSALVGGVTKSLVSGLATLGANQRLNEYSQQHCGTVVL